MSRLTLVLPLIFGSGACALAYQVAWLRQFRLLFGASTAASAAVLAIFIGGLGLGSWILGPRADKERAPLAFYAKLECGIAIAAALSPLLLWVAQAIYLGLGGSTSLGMFGASVVRLILAAVVLLPPTFLMGGTLPAAARALETNVNVSRQNTALLYGTNTLGAVTGAFVANFILVEELGNRGALFMAALFNVGIAGLAFLVSQSLVEKVKKKKTRVKRASSVAEKTTTVAVKKPVKQAHPSASKSLVQAPERAVLIAASVVGFAFFLMEMVWYRVLSPLIGGTVFSMGLILSVALLGVGIGGIAYAFRPGGRRPTLQSLAITCGLEAILLVGPFAFGDDIALWAGLLQNFSHIGFWGQVFGWTAISTLVILPGAIVSGYQFPLLIALLGTGREGIGRDAGRAYALNTAGAVTGSLAGGFGLMPLVGARGCWTAVAVSLVGLALYTGWLHQRDQNKPAALAWPVALATIALGLTFAQGPSTFWRHSGIGIGRFHDKNLASPNDIQEFKNWHRQALLWEKDGVESGIALLRHQGGADQPER
jgi:predicted membrane-bound spermidine synthase